MEPAAQEPSGEPAQENSDATAQEAVRPVAPESADVDTVPVEPLAQDTQAVDTAVSLDDIIVTSEKRAASIQEVPLTVNALTGQTLDKQGIRDFEDIQKHAKASFSDEEWDGFF